MAWRGTSKIAMTYAERLERLAPNLTSSQREALAKKRLRGLAVALAGLAVLVILIVFYGAFNGFGPLPVGELVGFIVLAVIAIALVWTGFDELQSSNLILRGAMAAGHPDDLFRDQDALRLYRRSKKEQEPSIPSETGPASTRRPCPYCGVWNSQDYSFCQKCGKPLPPAIT